MEGRQRDDSLPPLAMGATFSCDLATKVGLTFVDSAASGFMFAAAARHVGCRREAEAAMGELQPT